MIWQANMFNSMLWLNECMDSIHGLFMWHSNNLGKVIFPIEQWCAGLSSIAEIPRISGLLNFEEMSLFSDIRNSTPYTPASLIQDCGCFCFW